MRVMVVEATMRNGQRVRFKCSKVTFGGTKTLRWETPVNVTDGKLIHLDMDEVIALVRVK